MPSGTVIIAEIGENHLGRPELAEQMVVAAAKAGADIVKFQSYKGEDVPEDDPERQWITDVALSDAQHRSLKALAEQHGVEFLSAPFTLERARFLCEELSLRKIKIASSEMTNHQLLDYVNAHSDAVFISTGLADLDEVAESLSHLREVQDLHVLHCVTQYPLRDEDANLRAITTLQTAFPDAIVGYSDHTLGIDAAVAAVALGARVIEKHFTMDKSLPGTDHILSATPDELAEMVQRIRRTEVLLGSGEKRPVSAEMEIREAVRGRWRKN